MNHNLAVRTISAGCVFNETIINQDNQLFINKPGGEVLYTAAGYNLWQKGAGLIAKISENYSLEWINEISDYQINMLGVKKISEKFEQQRFYAIKSSNKIITDNPQKHFFEIGSALPKTLLGYEPPQTGIDKRNSPLPFSLRPDDIPADFRLANNLILCPIDYYTHSLIPPYFRSQTNGNVVLCASTGYMHPSFWNEIPALIRGSSVFLATEPQVRNLFLGKMDDIWEMIDFLSRCGVEIVGVLSNERSLYIYEGPPNRKYFIPPYPSNIIDVIGTFAAFCGGFGAGFTTHFDPLRAGLMGVVSASIKVEGSTPLHTFKTLPGLAAARLEALANSVSDM
ncbi:MAG: hypothetical protein MUP85_08955 [Candidatus Lokiarchaeota archaeon]|nr:hypothetical protein [Candidatus Lokiarchaeota archaeon]